VLSSLVHLGLAVRSLPRARTFYESHFGLEAGRTTDRLVALPVGDADVLLRGPGSTPRGGRHVHFAFATGRGVADVWRDRLRALDPAEHDFGGPRALYVGDPDGHCVEVGEFGGDGPALSSLFEVVLLVRRLDRALATYRALGFDVVDRDDERPRVRLRGPMDLELWEPHRGIAGARGGAGVELCFAADDPEAAASAVAERGGTPRAVDGGVRVHDADGHTLVFRTKL
jgi:catechol 2,3-dioxygenase-like lactoylglutathione lyase family enzyme